MPAASGSLCVVGEILPVRGLIQASTWLVALRSEYAVKCAPYRDGLSFDPFLLLQDGLTASEPGVGGCQNADALVFAQMIVVIDVCFDSSLEGAGQKVVRKELQCFSVLCWSSPGFLDGGWLEISSVSTALLS